PTPWLVLTDWLEENGDEADQARAEYCRLCLDRLQPKVTARDWDKGERRRELFRRWSKEWLGAIPAAFFAAVQGGLATVQVNNSSLPPVLDHLEADPERWAWVGGLTGTDVARRRVQSEYAPLVKQLCWLTLWGSLTPNDLELVANCPALSRLTFLGI